MDIAMPIATGLLTIVITMMYHWMKVQDNADRDNARDIRDVKDALYNHREHVATYYVTRDALERTEAKFETELKDLGQKVDRVLELLHNKADRDH
jgi:hypothetical protein